MVTTMKDAVDMCYKLAGGVNPLTDDLLPDDHVCLQPDLQKALRMVASYVAEELRSADDAGIEKTAFENSGQTWTPSEKEALIGKWNDGLLIEELCAIHKRSRSSIIHQLRREGAANTSQQVAALDRQRKRQRDGSED